MAIQPLSALPETPLSIKRALLSVSDKTGIIDLAKTLHRFGVELISTGGTAAVLRDAGLSVKDVSEITGFPECLDGRVKTLHPSVHGGLLARTSHQPDLDALAELNIKPIELVVVNLYPFEATVAQPNVTLAKATEFIDIGGPTMIRAAAKNFAHVCVLTSPNDYESFIAQLDSGKGAISFPSRKKLARTAFAQTARYDAAITNYMDSTGDSEQLHPSLHLGLPLQQTVRYGENPHQRAGVYGAQSEIIEQLHGKELSYNNYLDVDAALRIITDFTEKPAAAIIKHTNPSGVGAANSLTEAYKKAFRTDRISPFGGIVAVNRSLDLETAREIDSIFTEIIIAPHFEEDVLSFLKEKKNRRLLQYKPKKLDRTLLQFRSIFGGALVQDADFLNVNPEAMQVVTKREPSPKEWADLAFAWKVVKHVKSNAIVFACNEMTLGIGAGQTSRVDASEIAVRKAEKEELSLVDAAVASDAFFPFADGVVAAAEAGAKCIIQPGGSIRDEEVIAAADEYELAMVFTGQRHFRH